MASETKEDEVSVLEGRMQLVWLPNSRQPAHQPKTRACQGEHLEAELRFAMGRIFSRC